MDAECSNMRRSKRRKLSSPIKCSICLELIEYKKDLTFITCGHHYHDECINIWLEKKVTCPICRIPIFIQDFEQLEKYRNYLSDQKIKDDLRRRNLPTDDNAMALMFLRDRHLFPKAILELAENNCYTHLLEIPEEPSFEELYGDGFDSEEDEQILRDRASAPSPNLLTYYPTDFSNILNPIRPQPIQGMQNIITNINNRIHEQLNSTSSFEIDREVFETFSNPTETIPLIRRPSQLIRRNAFSIDNTSDIRRRLLRRTDSENSSVMRNYNTLFNSRTILDTSLSSIEGENRTISIQENINISTASSITPSISSYNTSTSQRLMITLPVNYNNENDVDNNENENENEDFDNDDNSTHMNISESESESEQSFNSDNDYNRDDFEKYARYEHMYQTYDEIENNEEYNDYRDYDDYRIYQNNLQIPDEESVSNSPTREINDEYEEEEENDGVTEDDEEENEDHNRLFSQRY